MNTLPSITFKNISFGFENESILDEFSFQAPTGQHTVLKGESGSGKSTMLQLVLGFYKPKAGQVLIDGNPRQPRVVREQSAWLPQDLDLGDDSVRNIMLHPFDFAANQSQKPSEAKLEKCLEKLGLGADNLDKAFRDLSTGQRQRVGLAVCWLLDKPLLLLDEPTSALDAASKRKVAELLLDGQRTIISTSHDPFWVERADRLIELD